MFDRSVRCGLSFLLVLFSGAIAVPAADEKPLAEEMPRIPHVAAKDAVQTFSVQLGFTLEQVAAEPLLSDPVDGCFDEFGRMFVVEMHDYPFSHEPTKLNPKGGGKVGAGIVRMLEDTDNDGRMDRSWKFATDISWPVSVTPFKGGVFVLAPPKLWYFKDTDGDHIADIKDVVFDGFNRDNVQALANNLKWGLDHRIYGAGATNPSVLTREGREVLKLGRIDFSFDPQTIELRPETGGVQFGHSFDDWGQRFVCSNSNHIQHVVFPYRYASRNPFYTVPGTIRSIAKEGGAGPVFRRSPAEPWRTVRTRRRVADPKFKGLPESERHPIGFFTSAAAVTIYRGSAYPELRGQAFIGDVGGNLIHRKTLVPNGVSSIASRADEKAEFIASTDNWFRPTNFVHAPDGTLYLLDMYRETIEHPFSIPDDIKEHLDLYSGDDRGRVYRLLGPNKQRLKVERLGDLSTLELVARLESLNAWTRETAHRLLWERQDKAAVGPLRQVLRDSKEPLGRGHALWTLNGLAALTAEDVLVGLKDAHPRVREQAIQLSERLIDQSAEVRQQLATLTEDADPRVLFQLALSIGEAKTSSTDTMLVLGRLLQRPDLNADVRSAALTSIGSAPSTLVVNLGLTRETNTRPEIVAVVRELTSMLGANPDSKPLVESLNAVCGAAPTPVALRRSMLSGAAEGLLRRGASPAEVAKQLGASTTEFIGLEGAVLTDEMAALPDRLAAADSQLWAGSAGEDRLASVLSPASPQQLQLAAIRTLAKLGSPKLHERLLAVWKGCSPAVRSEVVDALLQTIPRVEALLSAVEAGNVSTAEIAPDRKQLLLNHANTKIKDRAQKLLGKDINNDRVAVIKLYEPALAGETSPERGQAVFLKKCAQCHRHGKQGFAVGPDIVSVQNKAPGDLLISILDPSREAQPAFTSYTVVTKQGRIFNGLIAAESANSITLRKAEGRDDIIDRSTIEELISSGKSLMPEGLEKDFKPQDLADVIAFIKSLGQVKP